VDPASWLPSGFSFLQPNTTGRMAFSAALLLSSEVGQARLALRPRKALGRAATFYSVTRNPVLLFTAASGVVPPVATAAVPRRYSKPAWIAADLEFNTEFCLVMKRIQFGV
jgi:hypothetical protein